MKKKIWIFSKEYIIGLTHKKKPLNNLKCLIQLAKVTKNEFISIFKNLHG
jgi:hypothetical protein